MKDLVSVSPTYNDLLELRYRIEEGTASFTPTMLNYILKELSFNVDVCRIIKSAHIKHSTKLKTRLPTTSCMICCKQSLLYCYKIPL